MALNFPDPPIIPQPQAGTQHWNILGHQWAVRLLQEHLRRGQARHAYLVSGPEGVGRRTLALRFIQAMNCPNSSGSGDPCMKPDCRSCRQIELMQHPDLKVVQLPEGKVEIPIDSVRELQSFLMLAPYESPYKVGLLLDFQKATVQAQNALLKTLEEAPDRARLIITADSAENLLPTIVSRCELIRLRPLSQGLVATALQERQKLDPEKSILLDHLSGGRYGFAARLANDEAHLTRRVEDIQDLVRVMNATLKDRFQYIDQHFPKRLELAILRQRAKETVLNWQSLFRDILLHSSGSSSPLMNTDFSSVVESLSNKISPMDAELWITGCDIALRRIEGYCAVRLTMENLLMGETDVN